MIFMKKLIIAPHVDDEVIACGGILDSDSFVYYVGINEHKVAPDPEHRIPQDARMTELVACADFLGFQYEVNAETSVNYFTVQECIAAIEGIINKVKPEQIFLPHPGYNQDHQTVFQAAQVALRPHDRNHFVKKVLVYEAIHDTLWSHEKLHLNYFVPIDIERKLAAYRLQKSQVRPFRSPEMIRDLAAVRGAMAHVSHAEAFSALRWVE